jgi:hypothetical protein
VSGRESLRRTNTGFDVNPRAYNRDVSKVPHPEEPSGLTVLPPEEAMKRARPLPSDDEMVIEGLTDDEWTALEKALSER